MNLKKFFLAGAALSVALTSCNKDDSFNNGGGGEEKQIPLSLKIDSDALTKSIAGDVEDGHEVHFTEGRIYFTNRTGQAITTYELTDTITTTATKPVDVIYSVDGLTYQVNVVDGPVAIQDLRDGKTLTYLVGESIEQGGGVYVFGNIHDKTLPTGGHIDNHIGSIRSIMTSQMSLGGRVENAYLFGSSEVKKVERVPGSGIPPTNVDYADYAAEVEVTPISTRLELAKVTGETTVHPDENVRLAGYEIEGLFLNYFYGYGTINGTTDDNDFVAYTSLDDFRMNGSTTPWFASGYNGYTFEYDNVNGITTAPPSLMYTPYATGKTLPTGASYFVWGYNMFAAQDVVPHLIVKLKNVTVTTPNGVENLSDVAEDYPGLELPNQPNYYMTIKYYDDGNGILDEFKKGHVYTVEDLLFSIKNLKEVPEWEDDIIVNVRITVVDWTKVPVTVILD